MFSSNTTQVIDGGYQISRSLRFNSADSAYLNRTPASAGNRRTWTFSTWLKRSKSGDFRTIFSAATDTSNLTIIRFKDDDKIEVRSATGGSTVFQLATTQVFRDYSAWYHFVLAVDTTNATGGNRVRLYVNGSEVTTFDTDTIPTQNADSWVNNNILHEIARQANNPSNYYQDGYMTEMYLIDGTQLTPSSFGETNAQTGVWQPKAFSGSYGTNGFYLNFSDNSNTTAATLGKDYSGNGNNWTPNNFSVTAGAGNDSVVDSPTSYGTDTGVGGTVRGNYATLNPLALKSAVTLTNGNLDGYSVGSTDICYATIGMSSGKWYWEVTCISGGPYMIGISKDVTPITDWQTTNGLAYFGSNGQKYTNSAGTAYGATFTTGDVIGLALDMDAGTLVFYKNGTSQGTAFTGITGTYFASLQNPGANGTMAFNFGQRAFSNTAPSGYKALCTQNLPTPTIGATTATQAALYFTPTTYTGNGSSSRAISNGINMSANGGLVWSKQRSGAEWHFLIDNVRGNTKYLSSNATNAEGTISTLVTSFDSTGYSIGNDSGINGNGSTYVSWVWGAGGSGTTNTAGSITSTVSANTTSGFSIITWTGNATQGATIGHGLGAVPALFIIKNRSTGATNWPVKTNQLSTNSYLVLNGTGGAASYSFFWPNDPTSSIIYLGSDADVNGNGNSMICYAFAEVAGYSKFGSFTGNGSADGTFIYMGFRPAYVLIKRTDTGGYDWWIMDATRSPANAVRARLYTNDSAAESSNDDRIDFVSNGIKIRNSDAGYNASGGTYIYACFASNPFKYSLAR
jgi:hypothetical protein